jgi:hypothetical protein
VADYYLSDAVIAANKERGMAQSEDMHLMQLTRLAAAQLVYDHWRESDNRYRASHYLSAFGWSSRLLSADLVLCSNQADRLAAAERYSSRSNELTIAGGKGMFRNNEVPARVTAIALYFRDDAKLLVNENMARDFDSERSRLIADLAQVAQKAYQENWSAYTSGDSIGVEELFEWSRRWRDAALRTAGSHAERVTAVQLHFARMGELQETAKKAFFNGRATARDYFATQYYRADAEAAVEETKRQKK